MSEPKPPVNYLLTCSKPSLESFELSRLNQIANFRKELKELVEEWVEAEVEARLSRWILEQRRAKEQGLVLVPERKPAPIAIRPSRRKSQLHAATAVVESANG